MASEIRVKVKLFAIYQEVLENSELNLTFPTQTPVSKILEQLIEQHPSLGKWQKLTRFGINLQFVSGDTLLKDGDEVVLIPPVSGG